MAKNTDRNHEFSPDDPKFWAIALGRGLGPIELGTPRAELLERLKNADFEVDDEDFDVMEVYVPDINTWLYFAEAAPHPLLHLEIKDDRVRFGTLVVIGRYAHEPLALMQIPETETLWCDDFDQIYNLDWNPDPPANSTDADLLRSGTLWITSLGIGMTLSNSKISTLHLCDAANSPRVGNGGFTSDQRMRSENAVLKDAQQTRQKSHPLPFLVRTCLTLMLLAGIGIAAWQARGESQKWEAAAEAEAEVIAVFPPPPEIFPDQLTLRFLDSTGKPHEITWPRSEVYANPKIGETVNVRYLIEDPQTVMSPTRYNDIFFNAFFPYVIVMFGIYLVLQLVSGYLISKLL